MVKLQTKNTSYSQILKSTTIFGGSQIFVVLIGIIRAKIIAILLGTIGVGIIGVFYSIIDMLRSSYALGIDTAGVKEIAEINSLGDKQVLDKTISRYNFWFRIAAVFAAVTCIILAYPISIWAFDRTTLAPYIACLSISIFFAVITTGRSVILQGMRKISHMAKSSVISGFIGLLVTAPLYYVWGVNSIAFAFVITFSISFLCTEFYYRKLKVQRVEVSFKEAYHTGFNTIRLGFYIFIGGSLSTITMFIVRAYITRSLDIHATGLFQAAWTITNVYLGLILRSMGADFFPRLSAISSYKDKIKKLVNEQTYIILVVAPAAIVLMLLFSDFALHVLYSEDFAEANKILRWQILGTYFKVLSWPMAFIMLAKGKGKLYLLLEAIFFIVYLGSSYLLSDKYGLDAVGFGFCIAYIVYLPMAIYISKKIADFNWNRGIIEKVFVNLILILIAFYFSHYYRGNDMLVFEVIILIVTLGYAYFNLKKVFSINDIKRWFRKDDN